VADAHPVQSPLPHQPTVMRASLQPPRAKTSMTAGDVIYDLVKGNRRFLTNALENFKTGLSPIEIMMEDPLAPTTKKAVVLSCAYLDVPLDAIFDVEAGELQSIRVMGYVSGDHDGVMSSVDFSLASEDAPPLLLVLGDSDSEPLKAAMKVAMEEAGLEAPAFSMKSGQVKLKDLGLVQQLLPACQDALMQRPSASFEKLLEVAAKLNVWATIQTLMSTSPTVFNGVTAGSLQLHGAYIDTSSGSVQMMGQHPSLAKMLQRPPADDRVRTASSPSVPAEEAYAALVAGNRRFTSKKGQVGARVDDFVLMQLSEGGQQPMAIILAGADSRAPVELTFDKRPGDLFVLRTAGNIIAGGKSALLGSMEFAISALNTKLIVVTGHTMCGAVTEAVKAARADVDLGEVTGSIGALLVDLMEAARDAVNQMPDADIPEQVQLATKLNVLNGMKRVIQNSEIVHSSVLTMEVAVHGAVYDIFTGKVEFLGQHPQLEEIVGAAMPLHKWKVTPYSHTITPMSDSAQKAIDQLQAGNVNFVAGKGGRFQGVAKVTQEPLAIVVTGTEVKIKPQLLFDTAPGELVTQRCLGNIVGVAGGSLFNSLEYAVARFAPPVLLVLGDSDDTVVKQALDQVQGSEVPPSATRPVLDQVSVATVRALEQVRGESATNAGSDMKVMRLAVEFNIMYGIEQLLLNSAIIREAVKNGMEVQGAILDHLSGEVEFMGQHPMATELVALGDERAEDG